MRGVFFLVIVFTFAFLTVTAVNSYACRMESPSIKLNLSDEESCNAYLSYLEIKNNESFSDKIWARIHVCSQIRLSAEYWQKNETVNNTLNVLGLNEGDKTEILQLFEELKNYGGYRYITKHTPGEYASFTKEVNRVNSAICDCRKLKIVNRIGDWTSYEQTFKETCDRSPACYTPPAPCPGALYFGKNSIQNILKILIVPTIFIAIIIFLLKKRKS